MGFLEWMNEERKAKRAGKPIEGITRCTPSFEKAVAEWKQETEMRREWERTGKHSEAPPLKIKPIYRKRMKRVKVDERDIPF